MQDPVLDLLRTIIYSIVDTPDEVVIKRIETENKIVYYVTPKLGETGQIIGSGGSLAGCIRAIIKSAARRFRTKDVYMDVQDPSRERF